MIEVLQKPSLKATRRCKGKKRATAYRYGDAVHATRHGKGVVGRLIKRKASAA